MRVMVVLTANCSRLSGVQRHGINLVKSLLTRDVILGVDLVAAPWQEELVLENSPIDSRLRLHFPDTPRGSWKRNLWFHSSLPKLARVLGADCVHLTYPLPVNRRAFYCPTVVSLHDCYPYDIPENFGYPKVLFHRAILRQCLANADAIACVSGSTRARLREINPQSANKASVIYNAVEVPPAVAHDSTASVDGPFLLCVAQHRRNKNVLFAIKIFHRLLSSGSLPGNARMVVIGIRGPETRSIQSYLLAHGLRERVLLLEGISDTELAWYYRHCLLLLAPSTVEGFGLPVVEGLMAGCRVLCSDIPAFREVGGEHCRYLPIAEEDLELWADAVCIEMPRSRPVPLHWPQFRMAHVGEQYSRLYQQLLTAKKRERTFGLDEIPSAAERQSS